MKTLRQTQQRMAAALMQPLTASARMARRLAPEAAAIIAPNARLTSRERLEIYARSYWFRLLDALREDFPGLRKILGRAAFDRLAVAYLTECPSESFTLRDLGSRLPEWLAAHPRYGRLALDMARLEWAHVVAFDGRALPPLDPQALMPGMRIGVQPYITLLEVNFAVDKIRVARKSASRRAQRLYLAVHRIGNQVFYRRLVPEEFRLLSALRDGKSIARAITAAFATASTSGEEIPALLASWFAAWAQFGWLCLPERKRRK